MGKRNLNSLDQSGLLRYAWVVVLLFFPGCFHMPTASNTSFENKLMDGLAVSQGDVLVVFGENAKPPPSNAMKDYFTAGGFAQFETDSIGNLIRVILEENPHPGRFVVRHLKDLQKERSSDPDAADDSILKRMNLPMSAVSQARLRYAICVKEDFEVKTQVPLYLAPFGTAVCRNTTTLKADVWELPTEKFVGSLAVKSEGEYAVAAYLFHVIVYSETQKDAVRKLAQEIVKLLNDAKENLCGSGSDQGKCLYSGGNSAKMGQFSTSE